MTEQLSPDLFLSDEKKAWFTHDRFGMFIHWGLYSLAARHEWVKNHEEIDDATYARYFENFDPDLYDPKEWARRARDAGMKYVVLTAKHHEGFALWDSKVTDYKATATPHGRDLIRPFVDAFRAEGLRIGFYYSLVDWHHPDFPIDMYHPLRNREDAAALNASRDMKRYAAYMRDQVTELLTGYGPIDIIWFDFSYPGRTYKGLPGKGRNDWESVELLKLVRKLAPDIIVNNRLDLDGLTDAMPDVITPEQYTPRTPPLINGREPTWEMCQTFSGSWGYYRDEESWKSPEQLLQILIDGVSLGGNLLMNVGPTARGTFDQRAIDALEVYARWMRLHGRAIYGATRSSYTAPDGCRYTQKGNRLYLHIYNWPNRYLHLDGLAGKVKYAQLLNDASEVQWVGAHTDPHFVPPVDQTTLTLDLPVKKPDVVIPVVEFNSSGRVTVATEIQRERIALPMSRLGPPSRLPRFRWQQPMPNRETPPNFGLNEEESRHGFNWGEESILPYQVSDDYERDLQPGELDCVVVDNGRLRAVVVPSLGGRLLELKDLETGRDLVFRNPVFQPANLAALNAWFSGGIEWNGLIPGHSPFTCAPVFAGVRDTAGPILRIYEFDRIVEATWQIDLFLPANAAVLYAHGRIVNTTGTERLAYWWTNVATPMGEGTRVLSPAEYSIEHIWPGNNLGRCDFPRVDWDTSYPDNWTNATSVFFRAPSAPRLFIASVDRGGYGLAQTSTPEMRGRKFFYFGSAPGGQNWMDFLSRPGEGRYLEIQSGITPTQNQRFALAAREELDWTEAFFPVQLETAKAHECDYSAAVAHVAGAIDRAVPAAELARIDAFLREEARRPLSRVIATGSPWGRRQEQLTGRPLATGLDFSRDVPGDIWDDLAKGAAITGENLEAIPNGITVSKAWTHRIADSAATDGMSFVHAALLAIAELDRGSREAARAMADKSLDLRPNWSAYRTRALVASTADGATADYLRAWQQEGARPELAVEIAGHLMSAGRDGELKDFVGSLPPAVQKMERIVLARALVAANEGQFDELERLLFSRQFATIREGETLLSELWMRLRRGRVEEAIGRTATPAELAADLAANPVPKSLDLRMHDAAG